MRPLRFFIRHPYEILLSFTLKYKRLFPDKLYLKILFKGYLGYPLNLKNPRTYNEKLQWLKLYNRDPLYTRLVDKYNVKRFVEEMIGSQYVIPVLGAWSKPEDIDWDKLPERFVLKTSHDSGGVVVCRDKAKLDKEKAKAKLAASLARNYYWEGREWPYKDVPRCVFAEEYMEDEYGELRDYKWFCFDGVPKMCFVATGRLKETETTFDFFDADYNHLACENGHPNADVWPERPKGFEEMKRLAAVLSQGIPHVRVDFYEVRGRIYFGEMTFFHWGGMKPFKPEKWDSVFGDWIHLPKEKRM